MARKAKTAAPAVAPEIKEEKPVTATPVVATTDKIFDQEGELVVDVYETKADFVVLAAIAGIQIKDLDISLEKDMMVIKGDRCDPHLHHDKKYFYQECYWGPFSRKIVLPENIDIDKADAQIDKGILTVKIPKNEKLTGPAEKLGVKSN
ncbi:MAG: Hsp20/alpha crystallin family protein [Candidatus Staskawiczbacteria bacterium]|nr:Hsp20/alpha crystallin family protein [Candidatus Staskawiczbacteria bacterium]